MAGHGGCRAVIGQGSAAVRSSSYTGCTAHTDRRRHRQFTGTLWTYPQPAETLTRVTGTAVTLHARQERLPGAQGRLDDQVRRGALERQTEDLQRVLGRPATSLEEAVRALFGDPPV
ncbi:hypothetical protein [Streptomyces sp. Tue6028]|uniref:hypothetical protein n=1 Tax=Streptomyces sp. Tue6028 TaxID=2036037 RepID=UPI003D762A12